MSLTSFCSVVNIFFPGDLGVDDLPPLHQEERHSGSSVDGRLEPDAFGIGHVELQQQHEGKGDGDSSQTNVKDGHDHLNDYHDGHVIEDDIDDQTQEGLKSQPTDLGLGDLDVKEEHFDYDSL